MLKLHMTWMIVRAGNSLFSVAEKMGGKYLRFFGGINVPENVFCQVLPPLHAVLKGSTNGFSFSSDCRLAFVLVLLGLCVAGLLLVSILLFVGFLPYRSSLTVHRGMHVAIWFVAGLSLLTTPF